MVTSLHNPLKQAAPDSVYRGTIIEALGEVQKTGDVLLCRGKNTCEGLYTFYSEMFKTQLGKPNIVHLSGKNKGDVASGWEFSDGTEIILLLHQRDVKWEKEGKKPELRLILH